MNGISAITQIEWRSGVTRRRTLRIIASEWVADEDGEA